MRSLRQRACNLAGCDATPARLRGRRGPYLNARAERWPNAAFIALAGTAPGALGAALEGLVGISASRPDPLTRTWTIGVDVAVERAVAAIAAASEAGSGA